MMILGRMAFALWLVQASSAVSGDADALLGEWEQVATTAGACSTCRIAFEPSGRRLSVTANNGWTATLHGTNADAIVGAGRWESAGHAWVSGRPFTISFSLVGDRLHMTMTIDTGTEPKPVVRGVYMRPWQGM